MYIKKLNPKKLYISTNEECFTKKYTGLYNFFEIVVHEWTETETVMQFFNQFMILIKLVVIQKSIIIPKNKEEIPLLNKPQ